MSAFKMVKVLKKRKCSTFRRNTFFFFFQPMKGVKCSSVCLAPFCHIWRGAVTLSLPSQPHFYFISMLHALATLWSSLLWEFGDFIALSSRRGTSTTSFKTTAGLHRCKLEVLNISVNESLLHLYPFPSQFLSFNYAWKVFCLGFFLLSHRKPLSSQFFCHLTLCPDLKSWLSGRGEYFSPSKANFTALG